MERIPVGTQVVFTLAHGLAGRRGVVIEQLARGYNVFVDGGGHCERVVYAGVPFVTPVAGGTAGSVPQTPVTQWCCLTCTLVNKPNNVFCEVCGYPRPIENAPGSLEELELRELEERHRAARLRAHPLKVAEPYERERGGSSREQAILALMGLPRGLARSCWRLRGLKARKIKPKGDLEVCCEVEPDNELELYDKHSWDGARRNAAVTALSEMREEDMELEFVKREPGQSFGLVCVPDEEDDLLLVQRLVAGTLADAWNKSQPEWPCDAQLLEGDAVIEVNNVSGSAEEMLQELGRCNFEDESTIRFRVQRPSRRADAVMKQLSATDTAAAREALADLLLGDAAPRPLHENTKPRVCALCTSVTGPRSAVRLRPCGHGWFCKSCLNRWGEVQVGDGACELLCPMPECRQPVSHRQLRALLSKPALTQLLKRSVESATATESAMVACPTPDCPNRVWVADGCMPRMVCDVCHVESCTRCASSPFHYGLSCKEEARRQELRRGIIPRVEAQIVQALQEALTQRCTGCSKPIERVDACCHMKCCHCSAEFSWVCGAPWHTCQNQHDCLKSSIYLHKMPPLVALLKERRLVVSDTNASDLFLELRCLYRLSQIKLVVGDDVWYKVRSEKPELLQRVIRGRWDVPWEQVGDLDRLRDILPRAFP